MHTSVTCAFWVLAWNFRDWYTARVSLFYLLFYFCFLLLTHFQIQYVLDRHTFCVGYLVPLKIDFSMFEILTFCLPFDFAVLALFFFMNSHIYFAAHMNRTHIHAQLRHTFPWHFRISHQFVWNNSTLHIQFVSDWHFTTAYYIHLQPLTHTQQKFIR